jgi:hypothetical protein
MRMLLNALPVVAVAIASTVLAAGLVEQSPERIVLRNTAGIQDVYDTAQRHCAQTGKHSWAESMNVDASVYTFICQ